MAREQRDAHADEVQRNLPPDLALLLSAVRAEFDAKLSGTESRLLMKLAFLGIPLGAVGGFVAEMVKPGAADQALALLPFL